MTLDPPQTLAAGCGDAGVGGEDCGHDTGCNALLPEPGCDCPEDADEHLDACPEWQAEQARAETWQP